MPVRYTIDTQKRIIRTQCIGMVTFAEVVEHFHALERDPECAEGLDVLLDVSEVNSLPDASQIRAVALELEKIQKSVRFGACAVVAARDALFGMLRMFEVMAQDYFRVICVFRASSDAEAWLDSQRQQPA
ncbi:MAG TPA: hypothetical protein VJX69_12450 [Terriglobales bacterium]|nr:hypothetical protein [Terriglobales bacterium]